MNTTSEIEQLLKEFSSLKDEIAFNKENGVDEKREVYLSFSFNTKKSLGVPRADINKPFVVKEKYGYLTKLAKVMGGISSYCSKDINDALIFKNFDDFVEQTDDNFLYSSYMLSNKIPKKEVLKSE